MRKRIFLAVVLAIFSVDAFWVVLQSRYWARQELGPFHRWVEELDRTLPRDARILLVSSQARRTDPQCNQLSTRLYPRIVYLLPPGAVKLEEAQAWIEEKRLTWVISLGGDLYDPASAYARRIDERR